MCLCNDPPPVLCSHTLSGSMFGAWRRAGNAHQRRIGFAFLDLQPLDPFLHLFLALECPSMLTDRRGERVELLVVDRPGVERRMAARLDHGRPCSLLQSHDSLLTKVSMVVQSYFRVKDGKTT